MEYSEFKAKMDNLLKDYKEFILWLQDNIHGIKDLVKYFYEVLPKVLLIWGATKAVAEEVEDLASSVQRHYFAEYLDEVFAFTNPIWEGIDRYIFELIFYFLEYFGDKIFPDKDKMTFTEFAKAVLKKPPVKEKVKFKIQAK